MEQSGQFPRGPLRPKARNNTSPAATERHRASARPIYAIYSPIRTGRCVAVKMPTHIVLLAPLDVAVAPLDHGLRVIFQPVAYLPLLVDEGVILVLSKKPTLVHNSDHSVRDVLTVGGTATVRNRCFMHGCDHQRHGNDSRRPPNSSSQFLNSPRSLNRDSPKLSSSRSPIMATEWDSAHKSGPEPSSSLRARSRWV